MIALYNESGGSSVRRWMTIGILLVATASGCDKPKIQSASVAPPVPAPTTAPLQADAVLASASSTQPADPADNAPPSCLMMIDQQPVQFPPAMIRIQQTNGQVEALLYSDDPKAALSDSYQGNGFYFQLKLDVPTPQFDEATWLHHSESSERVDTPYGIFLSGHRRQLQPMDVRIRLLPSATGGIKVEMAGTFLSVDPRDDNSPTQVVPVAAWLLAEKP